MKKYLLLIFFFALVFQGCKKEKIAASNYATKKETPNLSIVFDIKDNIGVESREEGSNQMILGEITANPFLLVKMQEAEKSLYGPEAKTLSATDFLVEFYPKTLDEIKLLDEFDIEYFDYPLGREIIEMGNYDQELAEGELPILYARIDANFTLPTSISSKVTSQLYLDDTDEAIIAESFRLNGYFSELNKMDLKNIIFPTNTPLGGRPICPKGEHPIWHGPDWFECVPDEITSGPTDPTSFVSCVKGHKRMPGGRITVEDTQLSNSGNTNTYEPVRQVRVIWTSRWGIPFYARTNNNGCWKVKHKFYGYGTVKIRFNNSACKIRGKLAGLDIASQFFPLTIHAGIVKGPIFNDIDVNFHMWANNDDNQGSVAHLGWGAATTNNAVFEFHEYAVAQGIASPEKLDIFVNKNRTDGFALMHSQVIVSIPAAMFAPIVMAYLPEVMIGIDQGESDELKSTVYHELAHASHYAIAGQEFWNNLVIAEVGNWMINGDSHGSNFNPGIISLSESWAEHIGLSFTDIRYPTNNVTSIPRTWGARLERRRNEAPSHIPIGIYHDLIDASGNESSACDVFDAQGRSLGVQGNTVICAPIVDGVSGFSNAQMFSVLTPFTTNMETFRTLLISNHLSSTTNTIASVNALFGSY